MGKLTQSFVDHASIYGESPSLYIASVCEAEASERLGLAMQAGRATYIEVYTDQVLDFSNALMLEDFRRKELGIPSIYE